MSACVYILRLRSGGLYVGCAANIQKRYQDHLKGQACRTTKLDPPVSIVYSENYSDFHVVISIYRYLGDIWFSGK
jgi:predicted GIY-YIG superfamily endonuclease